MPEFDAYLTVDWSARSTPKTGEDSVWYCMVKRVGDELVLGGPKNAETRQKAVSEIRALLGENVERKITTLLGFDFPYGYPAGCAAAMQLDLKRAAPWRALWDRLLEKITDDSKNENNRFVVADEFNKRISGGPFPFWGRPRNHDYPTLSPKKVSAPSRVKLADYRLTEERAKGAQSVWKLLGHGAVGSQALLGIPHVARLRDDPSLTNVSRVWPFETGLARLRSREERDWLVLHAEIFPSIIKSKPRDGEVKDSAQVRGLAMHFARLDEQGCLSRLFEAPAELSFEERCRVETEEGWILGVE